jgi:hypothetical protein
VLPAPQLDLDFADLQAKFGKSLRRLDEFDDPQQVVVREGVVGQMKAPDELGASARGIRRALRSLVAIIARGQKTLQ